MTNPTPTRYQHDRKRSRAARAETLRRRQARADKYGAKR